MTELLFGLTMVFVVYVVYQVFKTLSETNSVPPPEVEEPLPVAKKPSIPPPLQDAPAVAAPAEPETPAPAIQPAASQGDAERRTTIRNPATGEVSAIPGNYRFAKKWIKEALVAEGLLDRIYKPNELDGAASEKVKEALEALRAMDKYQA